MRYLLGAWVLLIALVGCGQRAEQGQEPLKVGILHSMTGTMASSEQPVIDATRLAIEQINEAGGVLGRKIEPVLVDGASDLDQFYAGAKQLIDTEKIAYVFGCWTSASRKTVLPLFEASESLLFYPVQYEGLESSESIVYTGASPNQQVMPALKWCSSQGVRRIFLVGSDYVFPRSANEILKRQAKALRIEVVGEQYLPLGSTQVDQIIRTIAQTKPDFIFNTINGDSNIAFFRALRKAGISSEVIPTMSFSIGENELQSMHLREMEGDYAAWNYFQAIESEQNQALVEAFRARFGLHRAVGDPMVSAYVGVHLWKQAVEAAGTLDVSAVRRTLGNQMLSGPAGLVSVDAENQHLWKRVFIGKAVGNGQFEIVYSSERPVRPVPYPIYQGQQQWHQFLDKLYTGWGGKWAAPTDEEKR